MDERSWRADVAPTADRASRPESTERFHVRTAGTTESRGSSIRLGPKPMPTGEPIVIRPAPRPDDAPPKVVRVVSSDGSVAFETESHRRKQGGRVTDGVRAPSMTEPSRKRDAPDDLRRSHHDLSPPRRRR